MMKRPLPRLSVIVPVLNEAECLPDLFATLSAQGGIDFELILCDGGSEDGTPESAAEMAKQARFHCRIVQSERGRGRQMNAGAALAQGENVLFLHADSRLVDPSALRCGVETLEAAIARRGDEGVAARFALRFRRREEACAGLYYALEAKARLNRAGCIHGDQGFLLRRSFFHRIGPFEEVLPFLEDEAMAEAVFREGEWMLIPAEIETSARRFETEGLRERQTLNALVMNFFHIGANDLLQALPGIYRAQKSSSRLDLLPFFEGIREHLIRLSPPRRFSLWYRTGAFVRANAWQLPFAWDQKTHLRRNLPVGEAENVRLKYFDRIFDPLTDNPPGRLLAALLTRLWFERMLRRLRRQKKEATCNVAGKGV